MDSQRGVSNKKGKPWNVNHLKILRPGVNDLHGTGKDG